MIYTGRDFAFCIFDLLYFQCLEHYLLNSMNFINIPESMNINDKPISDFEKTSNTKE